MKKLIPVFLVAFFLVGCARATRSDFYQHDMMYRSWSHMAFSWYGYKNPTAEDLRKSSQQGWWGTGVPYVPGQ